MTTGLNRICQLSLSTMIAGLLLTACGGGAPAEKFASVTLNGNIRMIAGPVPEGTIRMRIYHLEAGEGELSHPLEEIEDFESDTANFTHTFEYPLHKGEGLAVHAWLDADGDGLFCTPQTQTDPSGLSWLGDTPVDTVDMTITLADNCRAANWFYPPNR
jgi:hypothetical protein